MQLADPRIVRTPITRRQLQELASARFGDMVKAVVDVARGIMALSGELHSDEDAATRDAIRRVAQSLVTDA